MSVYPSYLCIRLSICPLCLSVYLYCLSICLSFYLSVCLSICPSICPVYLPIVSVSLHLLLAHFLWRALSTIPPLQLWAEGAWMDREVSVHTQAHVRVRKLQGRGDEWLGQNLQQRHLEVLLCVTHDELRLWFYCMARGNCGSESHSLVSDSLRPHGLYSPRNSPTAQGRLCCGKDRSWWSDGPGLECGLCEQVRSRALFSGSAVVKQSQQRLLHRVAVVATFHSAREAGSAVLAPRKLAATLSSPRPHPVTSLVLSHAHV